MITIVCQSCKHALCVVGEVRDVDVLVGKQSDYWPDKYSCYNCGGQASGFLTPQVDEAVMRSLQVTNVNAEEAFAALNGLGVPEERTCCAEVVLPYFEALGIIVKGRQPHGQTRYIVEELTFPDGTRMQLGASPQGALIYRVVKKHSYAAAVKDTSNAG